MAITSLDKFLLLLWKNFAMERTRKWQFLRLLLFPAFYPYLLSKSRSLSTPEAMDGIIYKESFPLNNLELLKTHHNENQGVGTKPLMYHLAFSPITSSVYDKIVSEAAKSLQLTYSGYVDPDALQDAMLKENYLAGIEFEDSNPNRDTYPKHLQYRIRFPHEPRTKSEWPLAWYTNKLFLSSKDKKTNDTVLRNKYDPDGGNPAGYLREGFLPVQNAISTAFISQSAKDGANLPKIFLQRYPYPDYINDPLLETLNTNFCLLYLVGFLDSYNLLIQDIVYEKEKQLKEFMKMMGLQSWIHWTAWFAKGFLMFGFSSFIGLYYLKVKSVDGVALLTYSSFTALFFLLLVFQVANIAICFFLCTFFKKATTAVGVAPIVLLIIMYMYILVEPHYDSLGLGKLLGFCLLPNIAMCFAMRLVLKFEANGEGLQWSNISQAPPGDVLSVFQVICMMILSTFLYILLFVYVDQIYPGEFGIPKNWDFPFTRSFWCGEGQQTVVDDLSNRIDRQNSIAFEAEPMGKDAGVQVRNLTKTFGDNSAVKGLSLNMYEDEITVLLGHNGAGKTTTISMLTGMFPPTSGTATINGYDIRTDMDGARLSMGLCPQHNILFDSMTVKDHLIFYGRLKGLQGEALEAEVTKYIKIIELEDKADVASSALSGGMKRKLSVCAAFCGGTKVVLCDEPSAGMDPAARRQLWNLLQSEKIGRTVLLTTHFMDEADVLGDRIAIMNAGELKCLGTSFFLKKQFGSGYRLICVKKINCDTSKVTKLLSKYISGILPEDEIGAELSYQLPEAYSSSFEKMLQDLEKNSEQLQLEGYGISIHSLEDVFVKVGDAKEEPQINIEYMLSKSLHLHEGCDKLLSQWRSMFFKKYLNVLHNKIIFILMNCIPIITIVVLFVFMGDIYGSQKPITLSLSQYPKTVTVLDINPNVKAGSLEARISENYKKIIDSFGPDHEFLKADATGFINFILKLGEEIQNEINVRYIAAATVNEGNVIAWLNNQALHSAPLTVNLIHNAMARTVIGPDASIVVTNDPLPRSSELKENDSQVSGVSNGLQMCMSIVTCFFVMFLVKELQSRAKLLQLVSGIKVLTFWLSHFVFDLLMFTMTAIIVVITLLCFHEENLDSIEQLGRIFIILMLFGCSALMFVYLLSDITTTPSECFAMIFFIGLVIGVLPQYIIQLLRSFDAADVADLLEQVFLVFPHYAFLECLGNLFMNSDIHKQCERLPGDPCILVPQCCSLTPYFAWEQPGVLRGVTYLLGSFLAFFVLLLIKEYKIVQFIYSMCRSVCRWQPKTTEGAYYDDDVEDEKSKIKKMSRSEIARENLVIDRMTKFYGKFVAVNQISVAVKDSECFGLLGTNGAGKTTTFKMLTGDEMISLGEAYVKGYRVKTNMQKVYKEIGYCPQFDALFEEFTGTETLRIYCLIRGIPIAMIPQISTDLAKSFGFIEHIDKQIHAFSGGNKRKLSAALAVLGSPSVIYLDEPTAGMDPEARRQIWNMISEIRRAGKSIVLTSHNMEECEALCTRLAVMVNGEFKCLGSIQHLKNKFSKGFILKLKMEKDRDRDQSIRASDDDRFSRISRLEGEEDVNITRVREFIAKEFPNAYCKEHFHSIFTFFIPSAGLMWSKIFGLMESNKNKLKIEDYSLTQTTLEQIFLDFAQNQREAE